jgi:sterol 3beta-glucosyltransferase
MLLLSLVFIQTYVIPIAIHCCLVLQIKITERLVKIQNDGTVEVDVTRSALVASELSEIDAFGYVPRDIEKVTPGITKSVPKLKIAILVVGTRGDVQPFIALAKRLQVGEPASTC